MTERHPPNDQADAPDEDENPEFDRFEELTKKLLGVKPGEALRQTGPHAERPAEAENVHDVKKRPAE